jgi:hypothetical protein
MRIETGPYKPEGDWTGYFIRGDECLGHKPRMLENAAAIVDGMIAPDDDMRLEISIFLRELAADLRKVKE